MTTMPTESSSPAGVWPRELDNPAGPVVMKSGDQFPA
jgi:hypothetical protein